MEIVYPTPKNPEPAGGEMLAAASRLTGMIVVARATQ